ncbi:hypothetical protein HYY71_05450 [Candidatus Woesearchaeota archaeon]|nr:hypothetical protein [Candidatus Woesearchaeota archaeon]
MSERTSIPLIFDGTYQAEPDFFPQLEKYDGLRVRARVYGLYSRSEKVTVEVGLITDPRVPGGVPPDSLQGRIRMLLWNNFEVKDEDIAFIQESV